VRGDEVGIGGGREPCRLRRRIASGRVEAPLELERVYEVAVVSQRDLAGGSALVGRLRVLPRGRSGGRVADVTDREMAPKGLEHHLVEDLRDEPELLVDHHRAPVGDRDPGRLLSSVLQCVEPVEGETGHVLARSEDRDDAACVARLSRHGWSSP
jgi:hypothetical protein